MRIFLLIIISILISCSYQRKKHNEINTVIKANPIDRQMPGNERLLELCGQAQISTNDSLFWVSGEIKCDYRIFGYATPNINSKKLILFSVFTKDVEGNPYGCQHGSYYTSSEFEDKEIKYLKDTGDFVKTIFRSDKNTSVIFFSKSAVQFINN